MGTKTVRFGEFDTRVQEYWLPSDFDLATVSAEVAAIAEGWKGQGFVRFTFDDATSVLTQIDHQLEIMQMLGGEFHTGFIPWLTRQV